MKAIIDLGTNTFHLLIAEMREDRIIEHFKLQVPVMLGRGGINEGKLTEEAMERGYKALEEFRNHINRLSVNTIRAFATSAIRNASNGVNFMEKAAKVYSIHIEQISGDEEALFIYEGVKHSFHFPDHNLLVMDIGGGSVEFIIGNRDKVLWKKSFELGAARLMDKFHNHDPITKEELNKLETYFHEQLNSLEKMVRQYGVKILVGSAGSFETLVEVILSDLRRKVEAVDAFAYEVEKPDLNSFCELMFTSTKAQRKALRGMVDFRVDMIVVAAALMKYVVNEFGMEQVIASNYSLKEGMMYLTPHDS